MLKNDNISDLITGSDNLSKVDIQERLSELNKNRLEATGISQKRVLEEYARQLML
jgi:hypothetical protein